MTIKIVPIGSGLFVPASQLDAATARSFGADDNAAMTQGASLDQWRTFRNESGIRILMPS